jgi:hypothetical protein
MPIDIPLEAPASIQEWFKKVVSRQVFLERQQQGHYSTGELANLYVSRCYSCDQWAVWIADSVLWPTHNYEIEPTHDMPPSVKADFIEAAKIVNLSPRGAAALLRLGLQKLMRELGETGKDLNEDIGKLVKKGLDVGIQQAFDVVRVIGNNAVHPGLIDLGDDRVTALKLFDLLNLTVERCISTPKKIEGLFTGLPKSALEAIRKRDGT